MRRIKTHFVSNVSLVGAVLLGMFLLNACSKGNGPDEKIQQQLVISASSTDVMVGDEVTFVATADGKAIDADIYIEGTKINGTKYTFDDVGTYQAVAKRAHYEDSKPVTVTVKKPLQKVAKLKFNKVNTAPYTPAYGTGWSRMAMSPTHVYTINNKFKRYSVVEDKWEELSYNSLSGIGGLLLYVDNGIAGKSNLLYLSNRMDVYFPPEFGAPQFNDTWDAMNVAAQYSSGERAGSVHGKYIYYVGNQRKDEYAKSIDRYDISANKWETLAQMPKIMNKALTTIYNNKMYILGMAKSHSAGEPYSAFYVFDTQQLTVQSLPLPPFGNNGSVPVSLNQNLIAFNNYILFYDYYNFYRGSDRIQIFDIAANQWLENGIDIARGEVFDNPTNMNFMSPSSDKLYAAGTKGGNFILYELDFSVVEE